MLARRGDLFFCAENNFVIWLGVGVHCCVEDRMPISIIIDSRIALRYIFLLQ